MELALSRCVSCRGFLVQKFLVEVRGRPHKTPGHELVYGHTVFSRCRSCGAGQLEMADHDCFDWFDHWEYYGWHVLGASDGRELERDVNACPRPFSHQCDCETHRSLRLSAKRLRCSPWTSVVLPEWAESSSVGRNVYQAKLVHTKRGLPVMLAS
jgi:hypothetical protein